MADASPLPPCGLLTSFRAFMELSLDKKIAGVLAPLFALRGANDMGIGDTGALREFVEWAAAQGFALVQLLPVNETGGDHSPYNAISSVALDPTTIEIKGKLNDEGMLEGRVVMSGAQVRKA